MEVTGGARQDGHPYPSGLQYGFNWSHFRGYGRACAGEGGDPAGAGVT